MGKKGHDLQSILEKLQRPRGYQGCRIRPHLSQKNTWYAERYSKGQGHTRKSWQPLLTETNEFRTFTSPEEAKQALIEANGPFTDSRPFYIRLQLDAPKERLWRDFILQEEQKAPGSLEEMIKDSSQRLTAAMHELRECQNQRQATRLYEIIQGQSTQLSYLVQFVNQEVKHLQWLKVHPKEPKPS